VPSDALARVLAMPKRSKSGKASASGSRESEGPLFSVSASAESAREQVREEFRQLRAGIEKSLKSLDDGSLSTG
jgi:hypothetical protein